VKHISKHVSPKNKTTVSLCPMFHSSPLPPILKVPQNSKIKKTKKNTKRTTDSVNGNSCV
jgi:hypothetical protein